MMAMAAFSASCAIGLKFYLYRENRKLYREAVAEGKAYQPYVM